MSCTCTLRKQLSRCKIVLLFTLSVRIIFVGINLVIWDGEGEIVLGVGGASGFLQQFCVRVRL